jgi:hypothetical protein
LIVVPEETLDVPDWPLAKSVTDGAPGEIMTVTLSETDAPSVMVKV